MIEDIIEKVSLYRQRTKIALLEIEGWDRLNEKDFEDFEKIKTIDTFIYRFIKLQDITGEKLFKVFLGNWRI